MRLWWGDSRCTGRGQCKGVFAGDTPFQICLRPVVTQDIEGTDAGCFEKPAYRTKTNRCSRLAVRVSVKERLEGKSEKPLGRTKDGSRTRDDGKVTRSRLAEVSVPKTA